jgi:hypothetical protein
MLLVAFLLEVTFGAAFLLVPAVTMAPVGLTLEGIASDVFRLFGTALLGFATLLWYAHRTTNQAVKGVAIRALAAYYSFSALVLLGMQLSGRFNVLGWGMVATHVGLAVWFLSALKAGSFPAK